MQRGNKNLPADENNYSALINDLKQRRIEKRVLAYIKKIIRNSVGGYCCVSQAVIRKALKVRKQRITDACRNITERGELIRIDAYNKNRENPKPYYFLPTAELSGNSIKSSLSSNGEQQNEASVTPDKRSKSERKEAAEIEAGRIEVAPNFLDVGSWNNLERLSLIEKYLDAGLDVTPLIERGKTPPEGWTKKYLRTLSRNELLNYFVQNPQANVGCWMPENMAVVDADDLKEFYRLTGGEIWETLTASSGRSEGGLHFWFRHSGTVGSGNGIRPDLDFKGSGCLVVLPPSVHKSGEQYRWNNLVEPIDAPQLIQDLYNTRDSLKKNAEFTLAETARRGFFPFLTAETILEEGHRYDQLFRFGRSLRHWLNTEEVKSELDRYNQLCCQPQLDEMRMRKLVKDVLFGANRKDFRSSKTTIE
jgi:hypothetical protein